MPPVLFFILRITLAIHDLLSFQKCLFVLYRHVEYDMIILIGNALTL